MPQVPHVLLCQELLQPNGAEAGWPSNTAQGGHDAHVTDHPSRSNAGLPQTGLGLTSHRMASVESAAAAWITGLEARLLKTPTRSFACTVGCAGSLPDASKPYLCPTRSLSACHG